MCCLGLVSSILSIIDVLHTAYLLSYIYLLFIVKKYIIELILNYESKNIMGAYFLCGIDNK